jgi:hypothetical protein
MFTTVNEWIVLALVLLAGWLFGLASHPGGRKWRARYATERDAHAAYRHDMEARLSASDARVRDYEADRGRVGELERDRAELERARLRIAELERENARLAQAPAAPVAQVAPASPVTAAPAATTSTIPLNRRVLGGERGRRGWFDWGPGADPRAHRG